MTGTEALHIRKPRGYTKERKLRDEALATMREAAIRARKAEAREKNPYELPIAIGAWRQAAEAWMRAAEACEKACDWRHAGESCTNVGDACEKVRETCTKLQDLLDSYIRIQGCDPDEVLRRFGLAKAQEPEDN